MTNNILFEKDLDAKKIHVIRRFNAPVEKVWKAWTQSEILDKWWGPKPWRAETRSMDFTVGGTWLYAMVGPEGQRHWSTARFTAIKDGSSFSADSFFSDENGNEAGGMGTSHWVNKFIADGEATNVDIVLSFDNDVDIKTIVEMGFEGGFTIGLNQLEELLAE